MAEQTDVFPVTALTWLDERLNDDGTAQREAVRRHVMAVYFEPLVVYVKGSSYRSLGDAREIVSGFFSDRLGRDDYLHNWRRADVPLRAWLMRGLKYYCMETIRANRKHRTGGSPMVEMKEDADAAAAPGSAFRSELGRRLLSEAMRLTSERLEEEGMGGHWRVFSEHHLRGAGYSEIGERLGVSEERAAVMGRTAARRLRVQLRELCRWPGATDGEIDEEILSFMGGR